jgi:hypothetical protein
MAVSFVEDLRLPLPFMHGDADSEPMHLQEANKLVPNVAHTLCLAAKAWSDACYLDEIQSPFRERLTMQDRHEVNKKAIEYAKQVRISHCHVTLSSMDCEDLACSANGCRGFVDGCKSTHEADRGTQIQNLWMLAGNCAGSA